MIIPCFTLFTVHLSWTFLFVTLTLGLVIFFLLRRLYNVLSNLKMHNMVWQATPNYIFVLDDDCRVFDSNYYRKNNLKKPHKMDYFGDLFHCKNAYISDGCGKSEYCKKCKIRTIIQDSIRGNSSFEGKDVLMECVHNGEKHKTYLRLSGENIRFKRQNYILLIINDINREKNLEKDSEKANRKFFFVFDHLPVSCAMFDKEGLLQEANDTYLENMGLNDRSLVLNQLNIFDNPCVNASYKALMRKGEPISDEVKYDFDLLNKEHYKTRHRGVAYFRFIVNYLRNKEGEIQSIVIIWINNTLIHKTIRQNNNFQKMVQYSSSVSNVGFCSLNLLNKSDDEFMTYAFSRNLGEHRGGDLRYILSHFNQVNKKDAAEMIAYQDCALKEPLPSFEKDINVLIDGESRWIKMHIGQQVFDPEHGIILLGLVNIDITEQKKIQEELRVEKEKAESSDKLKSAFLANMSHEIRTPLNAIVGFSDLLAIAEDEDEKNSYKAIIQKNNELLLQLISDILDLAKIEANMLEFTYSEFNVNELIEEIKMLSEFRCQEKNPNIQVVAEQSLEICYIYSERVRLSQVINNFVSNAMKFTTEGAITIGYREQEGGLYFFCRDTGIGIKKDKVNKVFDRFVKLNDNQQGTGLGLSICQSIVEKLNGRIGVESKYGKGSTFWFFIPVEIIRNKDNGLEVLQKEYQSQMTKETSLSIHRQKFEEQKKENISTVDIKNCILIADANEQNYAFCEKTLKKDYEVIRAKDGEEVVALFLEKKPAAILMEIDLPKHDGFESTAAIRASGATLPIIGMYTDLSKKDKHRIYSSGITTHLQRPIKPQDLLLLLRGYGI